MIIGLASPGVAASLDDGLAKIDRLLADAALRGARIVCFPEAYLPGLRGQDFEPFPFDAATQERALRALARMSRAHEVAAIQGLERVTDAGRQIAAYVIDARGEILGCQTKNQLDPSEDRFYLPGDTRRLFEIEGVRFGIAICHEGWRYPETVRWAAVRGAKIVFHPQHTGANLDGVRLSEWGAAGSPYYEKAMMLRSRENTIYFASVNYALRFQESATSLIAPSGQCQAFLPYGQEGVLVQEIKVEEATGLLANRFAPERHRESETITIARADLTTETSLALIRALNAELGAIYSEPGANHFQLDPEQVTGDRGAFFVVQRGGTPVGCGAFRLLDAETAELKRMYVAPAARGTGLGRRLVDALEAEARKLGVRRLVLETGVRQHAALALYRAIGFQPIPLFGEYRLSPDTSVCLGKDVSARGAK